VRSLGSGYDIWNMEYGIWNMEYGIWNMEYFLHYSTILPNLEEQP
jgi:hypothetical protein